jgi:RNA polymerase sigma-54 factor
LSFALEMAMTPRFGLEVSPVLIAFSEMLILPYAAMQSVVEDELCANAALERLTPAIARSVGEPGGPGARCARSRAGRGTHNRFTGVAERSVTEPDTHTLLLGADGDSAAEAPIVEYLIDSLNEHGLLDRSCAQIAAELGVAESAVACVLDVLSARTGHPGSARPASPNACCCSWTLWA